MKDLLNVPWDMPKLRKRTQHAMQAPNSSSNNSSNAAAPATRDNGTSISGFSNKTRPHSMPVCPFPSSADNDALTAAGNNSNTNNVEKDPHLDRHPPPSSDNLELVLPQNVPPPPPGFEDSGDEYYLGQQQQPHRRPHPRPRPRMTLSFGVDTALKTLMFATGGGGGGGGGGPPFGLNDCEEVDPTVPLDRQE